MLIVPCWLEPMIYVRGQGDAEIVELLYGWSFRIDAATTVANEDDGDLMRVIVEMMFGIAGYVHN